MGFTHQLFSIPRVIHFQNKWRCCHDLCEKGEEKGTWKKRDASTRIWNGLRGQWAISQCRHFPLTPWISSTSEAGDEVGKCDHRMPLSRQYHARFPTPVFTSPKNPEKARLAKEENTESGNLNGLLPGSELSQFLLNWPLKFSYLTGENTGEMRSDKVLHTRYWSVWIYYVNGFTFSPLKTT